MTSLGEVVRPQRGRVASVNPCRKGRGNGQGANTVIHLTYRVPILSQEPAPVKLLPAHGQRLLSAIGLRPQLPGPLREAFAEHPLEGAMLVGRSAWTILRAMGTDTSGRPPASPTVASDERLDLTAAGILARRGLLVVLSANFLGRTHVIASASTVIGRQTECDFVLDDPLMSRRHFRITVDGRGSFLLEDLSSTNATFLNSRPLKRPSALHYGDRVAAGGTIFRFLVEEEIPRR